jgi:hypothetical protein
MSLSEQINLTVSDKDIKMAKTNDYYLVHYIIEGREVYSAVHWRDIAKFRAENEIISITA